MSRNATLAAATALAALTGMAPASATDLSSVSVHASFVGVHDVGECSGSTCVLRAWSQACEAVGVNGAHVPFATGCSAELELTIRVTGTGPARACAGPAQGHFTLSFLGETATLAATAMVTPAKATWETEPMLSLTGLAYAGIGAGAVTPPCGPGERTKQTFTGTFSYVRVP